ncbi:hypothetical protein KAU08_06455, partial [bacterium]|nr:hypothetical protein [bacterium]
MPELFLSIPLALLIILACHEAGRLILRILDLPPQPINRAIFKFALGLIAIEFVLSILGITGLLLNWLMWLLLIGLLASALKFGRESISSTVSALKSIWRESVKIPLNAILVWVI